MNRYERLKRHMYLFILPVITIASVIGLFFSSRSNPFNIWMLSVFVVVFSLSFLLLWFPNTLKLVEYLNLTVVTILHIIKFHSIITIDMIVKGYSYTGSSTYWTPLILVFIFIALPRKIGIYYALVLWAIMIYIGFDYWSSIPDKGTERLLQYYLSILVYIIFIYFVRRVITYYAEKETIERLAYFDPLTGIANRRKVYLWLEKSIQKKKDFYVVLFDIDHFKAVNDTYGHPTGDKVLKKITEIAASQLGEDDVIGRWGGEEFIIVTRREKGALPLIEQIRTTIANFEFEDIPQITASFGIAKHQDQSTELLLEQADNALYQAKRNGRNRVETYQNIKY
ncbi:GGDEF domain-containing protein [Gracilibacillus massiliensis]|uniref:GGDEF domain-containing protein n=1 Tax=Gracilibacillus massiliensis TaxID=1564956 RepID=UPI00071CE8E7|nr:GGDEF domain-containing protein [Gracilibacillus massiliensis]